MNLKIPGNGWSLVSGSYGGLFYSKLMRYYDGLILGKLGCVLRDSIVFDIGAGNGNFGFEAVKSGARLVYMIENSPGMIKQINKKKRFLPNIGIFPDRVQVFERNFYDGFISEISKENRPMVIHFRRCLYGNDNSIVKVLSESYDSLLHGGYLFVIQAERDNRLFDDDGFGRIAFDHVMKRTTFWFNDFFKSHNHRRFSRGELENICLKSCPVAEVEFLPSSRPAYHVVVIRKTG